MWSSTRSGIIRLTYSKILTRPILTSINFLYYQNFSKVTEAYNDFVHKIIFVIYKVALIKVKRIKHNSQEWFDGEITEVITNRDQLSRKF